MNGTLPKEGTWCEVDATPFPHTVKMQSADQIPLSGNQLLDLDDYHLLEASEALSRSFEVGMPFLPL